MKGRLFSTCIGIVSEIWPVKEGIVVRLERNDAMMVIYMFRVKPEDIFFCHGI